MNVIYQATKRLYWWQVWRRYLAWRTARARSQRTCVIEGAERQEEAASPSCGARPAHVECEGDRRFIALVHALDAVDEDLGIYPKAVRGLNAEQDYTQRDGYKNGWNAALMEYGSAFRAIVARAREGIPSDTVMLLSADVAAYRQDGSLELTCNDVWGWATSSLERVQPLDIPKVARLFRAYGWCGLLYWATTQHPEWDQAAPSQFEHINRFVAFVRREEELVRRVPDSDTRAFLDVDGATS